MDTGIKKKCERCGADISHRTHKSCRFCGKDDGDGTCWKKRKAESVKKAQEKLAKKLNKRCVICGGYVKNKNNKTCSDACSAKLKAASRKNYLIKALEPQQVEDLVDIVWPYKMPLDPCVTPADICPMG